jgi:transcriptional regulator with XRE-family HTH domain
MNLGQRIRELREQAKLTQDQLGAKFHVLGENEVLGKQAISAWEAGRNQPNAAQLAVLCGTFNVSADTLLGTARGATDLNDVAELIRLYASLDGMGRARVLDVARFEGGALHQRPAARNQS